MHYDYDHDRKISYKFGPLGLPWVKKSKSFLGQKSFSINFDTFLTRLLANMAFFATAWVHCKQFIIAQYTIEKILRNFEISVICIGDLIPIDNESHILCNTFPLLICTWFLKNQFGKIKFDKLLFSLFRTGFLLPV